MKNVQEQDVQEEDEQEEEEFCEVVSQPLQSAFLAADWQKPLPSLLGFTGPCRDIVSLELSSVTFGLA